MVHSSPELVEGVNRELYDSHTWKNPSWTLWTAHRFKSCCTSYTCESAHRLESVKRRICTSSRYSDNPSFANEWLHSARCILPMVLAVECVAAGLTISCSIHRWDDFYTRRCFQYAQYSCVDNSKSTRYKSTCIPTTLLCEFLCGYSERCSDRPTSTTNATRWPMLSYFSWRGFARIAVRCFDCRS